MSTLKKRVVGEQRTRTIGVIRLLWGLGSAVIGLVLLRRATRIVLGTGRRLVVVVVRPVVVGGRWG